jgi:methionyl aminopeptidase
MRNRAPSVEREHAHRHAVRPGRVSGPRSVPAHVLRPPYAATGGVPTSRTLRPLIDEGDIERFRRACRAARRVLDRLAVEVAPGVTTDDLDAVAHDAYLDEGGYPSTLGYRGYPKSLCTSVNEIVAHGIPDDRPLAAGEIVNCDVTIFLDGMHGDCSRTFCVGGPEAVDPATRALVQATEAALQAGIAAVQPGATVREIGRAIQRVAARGGYGIVRELVGHGIGEQFHGEPHVHHYDEPRNKSVLQAGMSFTIEPMLTLGMPDVVLWDDGWTIATLDGLPSAQFEHTVLVTDTGVEVLTVDDDGDIAYPVV